MQDIEEFMKKTDARLSILELKVNYLLEKDDRGKMINKLIGEIQALTTEMQNENEAKEDATVYAVKTDNMTSSVNIPSKRDTSRYLFNGNIYKKNRLVLAVVKTYIKMHEKLTREQLKAVFPKDLQGSIGVVVNVEEAGWREDYNVRFFTEEDEILHLPDGDMYCCNQWGILNINDFIQKARKLNFVITKI